MKAIAEGDIVKHKLTKEKMIVVRINYGPIYRCRREDMKILEFYETELEVRK